jgi:hypothetical protein
MHIHLEKCVNCNNKALPNIINILCDYPRSLNTPGININKIKCDLLCNECLSIHLQKLYSKRMKKND